MRCIFITHIHGDHQLGVLKIMLERDVLLPKEGHSDLTLSVITPYPKMKWML